MKPVSWFMQPPARWKRMLISRTIRGQMRSCDRPQIDEITITWVAFSLHESTRLTRSQYRDFSCVSRRLLIV